MKKIWEEHLMMEIEHLKIADRLLQKYEKKEAKNLLPKELPELMKFQSNKDYVRSVIENQVNLTASLDEYVNVNKLDKDHRFFKYQSAVNTDYVPSSQVIKDHISKMGEDYRFTSEGPHPIKELDKRDQVDDEVGKK